MSLQTTFKNLTTSLTTSFGATCTYKDVAVSGINPITGAPTTVKTDLSITYAKGTFKAFDKGINAGLKVGDFYIITPVTAINGTTLTPDTDDKIVIDSVEYFIFDYEKVSAQGGDVMFKLYLRG